MFTNSTLFLALIISLSFNIAQLSKMCEANKLTYKQDEAIQYLGNKANQNETDAQLLDNYKVANEMLIRISQSK